MRRKEYNYKMRRRYHWERSGFLPCSATCESGHQQTVTFCTSRTGVRVDENLCDYRTRPNIVRRSCSSFECQPRWEMSEWSQCSTSCGHGIRSRNVNCWKIVRPGVDSTVFHDRCELNIRPNETLQCHLKIRISLTDYAA